LKITCVQCQAVYSVDDALVSGGGIKVQCPGCGDIQLVRAGGEQPAVAAPASPTPMPDISEPTPAFAPPALSKPPASVPAPPADPFSEMDLVGGPQELRAALGGEPFSGFDSSGGQAALEMPSSPSADADPFASLDLPGSPVPPDPFAGLDKVSAADPPPLPRGSARGGGAKPPLPAMQARDVPVEPGADRCDRCGGMIPEGKGHEGLCVRCRNLTSSQPPTADPTLERDWRVRKSDGVILGPLTLAEMREKFTAGEVGATDQVARGESEFRLISSFPEFGAFFKRPGETIRPVFRHAPPSHTGRNILIVFAILLLGAGGAAYYFWDQILESFGQNEDDFSVVEDVLEAFSLEVPQLTGTSAEAVAKGRELMLRDERLGYLEADRQFKMALIIDPTNLDAYAGWVQNRALLDQTAGEVSQRKVALDLIDHALERAPDKPELLRSKAYLLLSLGQVNQARDLANKVLTFSAQDPEGQLVLGATYLESSTELAVDLFSKALEGNKDLNMAYRLLGEAKIRLGKFHEALKFFRKRLEKDPGQYASLDAMARVHQAVGKFDKARQIYEQILGQEPNRVEAAVSLTRLQVQLLGQQRSALRLLDELLNKDDKEIDSTARALLLSEKSVILRLQGKLKKATEAVDEALKLDPMLVPALYSKAWLSLRTGDVGKAIVRFISLRSHMPESTRVFIHIAEAEAAVPHFDVAIKQYQMAVEAAPDDLDVYLMLAALHLELDNPNQAYALLRKATKIDPFFERNHRRPRPDYDGPDVFKPTLARIESATSKYADDPLAQSLMGVVMWRAGRDDKAQGHLLRALGQDGECFPANLYLGALFLSKGQARKALPYFRQAHEADALHQTTSVLLAYAQLQTGNSKKAEKLTKSVLKADPGDLTARLCLAEIQLAHKQRQAGIESLLKIYEGDNENVRAKELLFNLGY
jgi:predicted Zn finger-like uncharacterized protein